MYPVGVAENYFFSITYYWKVTLVPLLPFSTNRIIYVKVQKSLLTNHLDSQDTFSELLD